MSRSIKKGPYVQPVLLKRIQEMNAAGEKKIVKDMVGHKLGEFAPTRTFKGHAGAKTTGTK